MKKLLIAAILLSLPLMGVTGCFSLRESGKDRNVSNQQVKLQRHGITLDAYYDPRLDNLVPGYKMITVGLTNQSTDTLRLNPLKDRWEIVDAYGKKREAINSLRIKDPHTFSKLPSKVRDMVEYPVGVSVGYTETVDLFYPNQIDLTNFRSISYYNAENRMEYNILTNLDSPTHVPAIPAQDLPPVEDPRFQKKTDNTRKNK